MDDYELERYLTNEWLRDCEYGIEQAYQAEKQAILDFLPEDVPGSCVDCDSCDNPCKQLQKADCGQQVKNERQKIVCIL